MGGERELPKHVIVTSRGAGDIGKKRHYALMCHSDEPLVISRGEGFDHRAYRNASGSGAPVGASQVTSLLRRMDKLSETADYDINLKAWLTDSYWVKLSDPVQLTGEKMQRLARHVSDKDEWLELAKDIRGSSRRINDEPQGFFSQLL